MRLSLVGILVAIVIGFFSYRLYQEHQWLTLSNEDPSFSLSYHKKMVVTRGTDEEKEKGEPFIRLSEGQLPDPFLISIRKESGLRLVTSLTRQDTIPMLLGNAENAYPQRFPEYHKESEWEFELTGKKAAELIFTYQGPSGERIKQRFLIIAYDGNTALYFAAQAKESDFDELNKKYIDRIFESLTFN